MRFIHAADIHLDSPLSGLSAYDDAPADALRTATRDAFTNLIDVAIEEAVDFIIIAGDLYDGNWKDFNTGFFFVREMGRLNLAGIPVYLLFGNHDAESEMTRKLILPPNVHAFDSRKCASFRIASLKVALHGRSFKEAATTENLVIGYPAAEPGWLNIGVLHTALEGNAQHAAYAPCSLAELSAKGYDYWALGHVHEFAIVQEAPCHVVFPGNLQGRHIRETGARGAVLVNADETGILTVERLLVDVLRWHHARVDAGDATTLADVIHACGRAFEQLLATQTDSKPIAVRVSICGTTAAHGELFGMESQLRAEIIGQAGSIGIDRLWVEKVRIETAPLASHAQIRERSDAIAELQLLLDEAPHDEALLESLALDLQQMVGKMPLDLVESIPDLKRIREGHIADLVRTITPGLIAHLANSN
ncbi:MAG: DNA repair exonuclease [Herminiimonas sp.]|nr:DNA repair exonuclease [Herminiimonas sp.]